jgi:hypothetical protein
MKIGKDTTGRKNIEAPYFCIPYCTKLFIIHRVFLYYRKVILMRLTKKSQSIIMLGVIAVVIVLLSTNLNLTTLSADSTFGTGISLSFINNGYTKQVSFDAYKGQNEPGSGSPFKELFSDTKFITSFKTTGVGAYSERIAFQGNLYENSFWESWHPTKGYYRVSISDDGVTWDIIVDISVSDTNVVKINSGTVGWSPVYYDGLGGLFGADDTVYRLPMMEVQLIGPYVGAIKVETVWHFEQSLTGGKQDKVMATDYAYLISGSGDINIKGYASYDIPMFENGETVTISVTADYSGKTADGNGRWELWAYPLKGGSGQLIKSWAYDNFREDVAWKLPADAWVRGTSNSRWRIELHNTLFSTSAVDINTIDLRANAPPTPTISISPPHIIQGAVVTLNITGNTNKLTNESLLYYAVILRYTSASKAFFEKDVAVTGSDPYRVATTFTAPNSGELCILVLAHDVAGRETEIPAKLIVTVSPQGTNPTPDILPGDISMIILVLLVVVVIAGVGLYIYQKRGKGKTAFKMPSFKLPKWGKKK